MTYVSPFGAYIQTERSSGVMASVNETISMLQSFLEMTNAQNKLGSFADDNIGTSIYNSENAQAVLSFASKYEGKSQGEMSGIMSGAGYQFDYGAWCADFVYFVLGSTMGGNLPDWYKNCSNKAYCPTIDAAGKAAGAKVGINQAQPGDLVLFDWDGDGVADHIGILVDRGDGQTITTIEGNTSGAGGGSCVSTKSRNMGSVLSILAMS